MNYKLLSGCYAGSIVEEGQCVLDLPFKDLDEDLQIRIREWAENKYRLDDPNQELPISLDEIKELYELSWESEETEEEADLKSASSSIAA